jgi:hypothetical protein
MSIAEWMVELAMVDNFPTEEDDATEAALDDGPPGDTE